jgi:hypothetical protein
MTPWEAMDRLTLQQARLTLRWLDDEWNHPDRTDHYLMQIACAVVRSAVKDPKTISLDDFKLQMRRTKTVSPTAIKDPDMPGPLTKEQIRHILAVEAKQRMGLIKKKTLKDHLAREKGGDV